jgi:predicted nuclease of predicted toxin-antitoxin system
MNVSILVDMNLSAWVQLLDKAGWPAVHWSNVGAVDAEDYGN